MGCANCGNRSVRPPEAPEQRPSFASRFQPPQPCDYTVDQMIVWANKLICAKDSGLYIQLGMQAKMLNKYLGIVLSAKNYKTNICFFKNDLDTISNWIIAINNTGKC